MNQFSKLYSSHAMELNFLKSILQIFVAQLSKQWIHFFITSGTKTRRYIFGKIFCRFADQACIINSLFPFTLGQMAMFEK